MASLKRSRVTPELTSSLGSSTLLGSETRSAEAGGLRGKGPDLFHPGRERDYYLDRGILGTPASLLSYQAPEHRPPGVGDRWRAHPTAERSRARKTPPPAAGRGSGSEGRARTCWKLEASLFFSASVALSWAQPCCLPRALFSGGVSGCGERRAGMSNPTLWGSPQMSQCRATWPRATSAHLGRGCTSGGAQNRS